MADAARDYAAAVQAGREQLAAASWENFSRYLYTAAIPEPDLLIRTAGEMRISNFLLWQVSYAEIFVSDVCWPDFGKEQLHAAFRDYGRRVRKFGKVL